MCSVVIFLPILEKYSSLFNSENNIFLSPFDLLTTKLMSDEDKEIFFSLKKLKASFDKVCSLSG